MIQINKEYLQNDRNISNIIEEAQTILNKRKLMYGRYTRKNFNL